MRKKKRLKKKITVKNKGSLQKKWEIKLGRYKGRTYKEIWENDREYCKWVCENIIKVREKNKRKIEENNIEEKKKQK